MTKMIFLHGIGKWNNPDVWLPLINQGLRVRGKEPLVTKDLMTPDYVDALRSPYAGDHHESPTPPQSPTESTREARSRFVARRDYLANMILVEALPEPSGPLESHPEWVSDPLSYAFPAVRHYVTRDETRRTVWDRVLDCIEPGDQLVVVGHSLGSVIAVDLMSQLPEGVEVQLLLTLGSPLGHVERLRRHSRRLQRTDLDFPYGLIKSWVNVYSLTDGVTGGRGVGKYFRNAIDVPVSIHTHDASAYLTHPATISAIAYGMYGSDGLPERRNLPVRVLDQMWIPLILKFAYAEQLQRLLPTKEVTRRRKFQSAREVVAGRTEVNAKDMASRADWNDGSPGSASSLNDYPTAHELLSDSASLIGRPLSDEELVPHMITLLNDWPMPPFRVLTSVSSEVRQRALYRTLDLVRAPKNSISNDEMVEQARKATQIGREVMDVGSDHLWMWLLGAGLAALAVSGVGLVLAVPAGLAGAAAIAATLAAFGPGGMVGGVTTLAVLAGVAGAGIGGGLIEDAHNEAARKQRDALARSEARATLSRVALEGSIEALKSALASLISMVNLQERCHLTSGRSYALVAVSQSLAAVRDELRIHDEIDEKRDRVKDLERRVESLERAVRWLASTDTGELPDGNLGK